MGGPRWPARPLRRLCPVCAADADPRRALMWQLPLTVGCMEHGCPARRRPHGQPSRRARREAASSAGRRTTRHPGPLHLRRAHHRTGDAARTVLHAGVWFRSAVFAGRGQSRPHHPKLQRQDHAGAHLAGYRPPRARRPERVAALRADGLANAASHAARRRHCPATGRGQADHRPRHARLRAATSCGPAHLRRRPARPLPERMAGGNGGGGDGDHSRAHGPRHRPATTGPARHRLPHTRPVRGATRLPVRHRHPRRIPAGRPRTRPRRPH